MEVCHFHHKGNILMICSTKKKMANTKAISTPMASEVQFSMRNDGPFQDAILYRRIAIIYVKPFGHTWESHQKDIGVLEGPSIMACISQSPTLCFFMAILMQIGPLTQMSKSTSGYYIFLGKIECFWSSKKLVKH